MDNKSICFLSLLLVIVLSPISLAESDNTQQIYEESKLAVVKILTYVDYDMYLPNIEYIDWSGYNRKIESGGEPTYEDLDIDYDRSTNYFEALEYDSGEEWGRHNVNVPFSSGTGFIISSDGYILTNAHVGAMEKDSVEEWLKGAYLITYYYSIDEGYQYDPEYSYDDYLGDWALYNFMVEHLEIRNLKVKYTVVHGVDKPSVSKSKKYTPRIIDSEGGDFESIMDWVLLKINGKDLDYVELGDSDKVKIGTKIVVSGDPFISEEESEDFKTDVDPTLSTGYISQIKSEQGNKIFQVDLSITEGNSGGPAFDTDGNVIGIVTYGLSEYIGGNFNYLLRINDIKKEIEGKIEKIEKSDTDEKEVIQSESKEDSYVPTEDIVVEEETTQVGTTPSEGESNHIGPAFAVIMVLIIGLAVYLFKREKGKRKKKDPYKVDEKYKKEYVGSRASEKKESKKKHKHTEFSLHEEFLKTELNTRSKRMLITGIVLIVVMMLFIYWDLTDEWGGFLIIVGVGLGILGIWLVYLGITRLDNPTKHPAIKRLSLLGDKPITYVNLLEKELHKKSEMEELDSKYTLTPNFLIYNGFYKFIAYSLHEAAWAYILQTKHSVNFIPTGTSWSLKLHLTNGAELEIKSHDEEEGTELLNKFLNWAPFMTFGHSDEIKARWYGDREGFINEVHQRAMEFFKNPHKFMKDNY